MARRLGLALFILHFALFTPAVSARDWIHWRGPEENGVSRETGLPEGFDPKLGTKGNVVWQQPFGGRSAPLVLDGQLFLIQGTGEGLHEGEQVVCFDEKTGKEKWRYRVNVFHTDIVSSRLGWTTLTADPDSKNVYAHTTAGLLLCLSKDGKLLWQRSLTEEFGRISGYGGRIVTPIFDSGLCIVGMVNSSWGDQARAANRFVAFDGKTGEVVWWAENPYPIKGTYYSSPVIAVIGGQRVLVSGGADGYLSAYKVRTGERLWSYKFSAGVVNGSPLVSGNLVYCHHGEENPEGGPIGRLICVDASQVDPKTKTPKLVWEYRKANRFGLASGALADGRLYIPDDSGELFCFSAKAGKLLWKFRYGTEVRGAPLIADGKLYIFDVKGRLVVLTLAGDQEPANDWEYKFRDPRGLLNETNGTVIAVNNRLYFTTRTDLYCLGTPDAKDGCGAYTPFPEEAKFDPTAKPAGVRVFPADVEAKAGEKLAFKTISVDANGRELKPADGGKVAWSLPAPQPPKAKDPNPKAPASKGPPPLNGTIDETGTVALAPMPSQQGYVEGKVGDLTGRARVRVVAQTVYKQDFDKVPVGAAPGGWVNVQSKYAVKELPDGNKVLSKVNTDSRPPFARANGYITLPTATGYTIQADVYGTEVRDRLPDIGLVNCRYTLILDGKTNPDTKKREVRIVSWEARPRVNVAVDFDWSPNTWYTAKFTVEQKEKTALVRGKVWKKGDPEPAGWTVEFEDPSPNREGAAALYGYVSDPQITPENPGSDIYYDNVVLTPNGKNGPGGKTEK
ncbi:MAG: afsK 2 [Gemmataceae bacterium]|nr:afsK 2 [Gemmataceae bacterium]